MLNMDQNLRIFATEVKAFTDCARTAALQRLSASLNPSRVSQALSDDFSLVVFFYSQFEISPRW